MTINILGTAYVHKNSYEENNHVLPVTVPDGTDLLLFFAQVNRADWAQLTGPTVNGSAVGVVQAGTTPTLGANRSIRAWYVLAPTAGTYNIEWDFNTSSENAGGLMAMYLSGTHATAPISAAANSSVGAGSSPLSTAIVVSAGGLAVAAAYADTAQPAPNGSQTEIGTSEGGHCFSYKSDATAMAVTFTGAPQIAQLVIAVKPAAVADTTVPTMTGTLTSSGVTSSGFTISWAGTTRGDNVAITGYETSPDNVNWTDRGNVTLLAFTGKAPSTSYTTYVRAYDAANNKSTPALSLPVTTAASSGDTTVPSIAGSMTAGTITQSALQYSWPAGTDNVAVTSYEVSTDGGANYANVGNVLTYTSTGLNPSTTYPLRVRAVDAAGNHSTPLSLSMTTSASTGAGTINTSAFKTAGVVQANLTNLTVTILALPGLTLVKTFTGETTDGSGVNSVSDALLAPGTTYAHIATNSAGTVIGAAILTAA